MDDLLLIIRVFIFGIFASIVITPIIIKISKHFKIVATHWLKNEIKIPLMGGVSIFISFILGIILFVEPLIISGDILLKYLVGISVGALVIVFGGILDDKYSLPPKKQFIFPIVAIIVVILSGVGVSYFTNPFSPEKLIYIDTFQKELFVFKGIPYQITFPADLITFIWLAVIMYSTKLQDGLDGLVSGISFIGSIFIFLISYFVFNDVPLAIISALFAGILLGFLRFNFHPAKIFLGESGSLLAGFILGVLALLSDAKVIITLLLLAIPISDAVWTVARRIYKKKPFWKGDQDHLHHRLIQAGLSSKKAVLLLYGITLTFGVLVMLWQSSFQFYFFGVAILALLIIIALFAFTYSKSSLKAK